jgi:hypothetical protein
MSKIKLTVSVILTLGAIVLVSIAERRLNLPQSVSLGILMLSTQVLTYPIIEWWYEKRDRKIAFKKWALGAVVSSVTAVFIHIVIIRLIGTS